MPINKYLLTHENLKRGPGSIAGSLIIAKGYNRGLRNCKFRKAGSGCRIFVLLSCNRHQVPGRILLTARVRQTFINWVNLKVVKSLLQMKKVCLIPIAILLSVFFSTLAYTQDSNLKEDYSALIPEVQYFNSMLLKNQQPGTVLTKEGLAKERNMMKSLAPVKTTLQPVQKNIPGPGGSIRLVIYKRDRFRAVVGDIHVGAWGVGSPENDALLKDGMARTCKVAVLSVDYRLAPENPFPACIEDCKAVARWLVKNAMTEFGTDKIFISGASAGGHLSAVTAIYIRDSLHAIDKVKGLNLVYGCFDLGRTPSSRHVSDSAVMLNKKSIEESMQLVFGGWTMEKLQQPEFSPLYANLKGLPPALFTVGAADPLLDDSYFMEDRWRSAGNRTFLAVYPAAGHLFNIFPTKMARAANERMFKWIVELSK